MANTTPPSIALNSGYAGHYAGSKYTATPGVWTGGVTTGNWQSNGVDIPGATGLTYTLTFAQEGLSLRYQETNTGVTVNSNALTRPALVNLIVDTVTRAEDTSRARPGYGNANAIIDPLYGTRLTRITGDPGTQIANLPAGQLWADNTRARYESNSAWNCDESIMYLDINGNGAPAGSVGGASTYMIFLDGQTYVPLAISRPYPAGFVEGRWSNFTPNNFIYVTSTEIRLLNVNDGSSVSWHNFGATYNGLTIGGYSGVCSRDGDIWPLLANRISDSHVMGIIYKHSTDTILAILDFGTTSAPTTGHGVVDDFTISPSGTYARIYYVDETAAVYTVAGVFVRSISDMQKPSHFTPTYDASGNDVAAGSDRSATAPGGGKIIANRFSDGLITTLNPNSFGYHTSGTLILGVNADKWIQSDYWTDSGAPYQDELVVIAKNGSARGRIGNIMRGVNTGWSSNLAYANETQSSQAPVSKRAVFHTSWRSTTGFPIATFVLDWRAFKFAGVEGAAPVSQTVNITCTSASTRLKQGRKVIAVAITSALTDIKRFVDGGIFITCASAVSMTRTFAGITIFPKTVAIVATTGVTLRKQLAKLIPIITTNTFSTVTASGGLIVISNTVFIVATSGMVLTRDVRKILSVSAASLVEVTAGVFVIISKILSIVIGTHMTLRPSVHTPYFSFSARIIRALERLRKIWAR